MDGKIKTQKTLWTIPGSGILASSLSFPQNQEVWLAHLMPPDVCWGAPLFRTECWKMESGICAREASCRARLYWAGTCSLHKLPTQRWAMKLLELLLRGVHALLHACMHARMCVWCNRVYRTCFSFIHAWICNYAFIDSNLPVSRGGVFHHSRGCLHHG